LAGKRNLYVGRAGQLVVMAELLLRGWNVALPEVDLGDDVFVVKDEGGDLSRIQVKTATTKPYRHGYSAQFTIGLTQLTIPRTPDLVYIFVVRHEEQWAPYVIIGRDTLSIEHKRYHIGSESKGKLLVRFLYEQEQVRCGPREFTQFRSDWSRWPILRH
jgi:hypothetical protein